MTKDSNFTDNLAEKNEDKCQHGGTAITKDSIIAVSSPEKDFGRGEVES